jgi:hypothetical protein
MHLVQLLLPLYDNSGHPFPRASFEDLRREFTDRFGGVTAFVRSPALGLWKDEDDDVTKDDVVMFEVMTDDLDHAWWGEFKKRLEAEFQQQDLLVRAIKIMKL